MYILVVIRLNNLPEGNEHDTNSNGLDTQDRSRDMSRQLASCHGDVQAVPVPGKLYLSYTSLNYNLYIYIYMGYQPLTGWDVHPSRGPNPQAS